MLTNNLETKAMVEIVFVSNRVLFSIPCQYLLYQYKTVSTHTPQQTPLFVVDSGV